MILTRRPKLTAVQQRAYDEMLPLLVAGKREFQLPTACSAKDANTAYMALHSDHFELFWLGMQAKTLETTQGSKRWTTMSISEIVRDEKLEQYKTAVAKEVYAFLQTVPANASTYEKVCRAYEYVVDRTEYDMEAKHSQNLLGVFLDRRSACAGYSEAFALLLEAMGIPAACVTGTAKGGNHEWNIVCIDGTYVFVDVTWGDPTFGDTSVKSAGNKLKNSISHAFLCVTDADLASTHTPDSSQLLPACNSDIYDWYARNGRLVKNNGAKTLDAALAAAVRDGKHILELKFATKTAFEDALGLFSSKGLLAEKFGRALSSTVGAGKSVSIAMTKNDAMRTITVAW